MKTADRKPKSPEQMQAALAALMLEAELCERSGDHDGWKLLVGYAGVIMWATGWDGEGVQSLDQLFNALIAQRDQLVAGYLEAHPGGPAT